MARAFEQLDHQVTPMGVLSLRRRFHPTVGVDVWEAILDDEHLMSSLFTASEEALATLGLGALDPAGEGGDGGLDVVVGGLGLGYTAARVLDDPRVVALHVIEYQPAVVEWHERDLLPLASRLVGDGRCQFVVDDFFARALGDGPLVPGGPNRHDAILVDIDHTPDHLLDPSHAPFYEPAGLAAVAARLTPGGVFGLWSDARPDDAVVDRLLGAFASAEAHEVRFPNPLTGGEATNTVYLART